MPRMLTSRDDACTLRLLRFMASALGMALFASIPAASAGSYVTQSYIDTTVQRAYFLMGEADDGLHSADSRRAAICQAKEIAARLRKLAQTDANRNYILHKVAELESQIRLEEEALDEEAGQAKASRVNILVADYNAEIGRQRPNFAKLKVVEQEMRRLEEARADEMANGILQRVASVSGGLVRLIQNLIEEKKFDSARIELAYCKAQQQHLWISVGQYAKLEASVQSQATADAELRFISSAMTRADSLIAVCLLGGAWELIRTVDARLAAVRSAVRRQEWERHHFRNRRIERSAQRVEDSLVNVALGLLRGGGQAAASDYCAQTLKPAGVSPAAIAKVNSAILASVSAGGASPSPEISAEVAALTDGPSIALYQQLRMAAKSRARTWTQAVERDTASPAPASAIDRLRQENLLLAAQRARDREAAQQQWRRQEAEKIVIEIYKLLSQKKGADARKLFESNQSLLRSALSENDVAALVAATGT